MANKKYLFVAALIVFFQTAGMAQTDWGWDWKDSSKVPTKSLPQYNEFLNNQFPYPPKPRNQWELALNVGYAFIGNSAVHPTGGVGGGASLRKAIDHNFSFRVGVTSSVSYGQDYRLRSAPGFGGYSLYTTSYVPNYQASIATLSTDLIYSINPMSYYRGNPKWNLYVFAGYSMVASETQVDARNHIGSNYVPYNYSSVNFNGKTKDIVTDIKALQDGDYDMPGYNPDGERGSIMKIKDRIVRNGLDFGFGASQKISKKFNVGLEQKFTTLTKYTDGSGLSTSTNLLCYTSLQLHFNL